MYPGTGANCAERAMLGREALLHVPQWTTSSHGSIQRLAQRTASPTRSKSTFNTQQHMTSSLSLHHVSHQRKHVCFPHCQCHTAQLLRLCNQKASHGQTIFLFPRIIRKYGYIG